MKRLTALLLALLLLAPPALAEPMSYLDYTDDILEDGSPIYYFPELSLKLPPEWQGRVIALRQDNGTAFYQKASYDRYQAEGLDGGGRLFTLGCSVNGSFSRLPAFEYLGFSEASSLNYYLELPTDYPAYFEDGIRAEYDAMAAQIGEVVQGVAFYPGTGAEGTGVEGTDAPGNDSPDAAPNSGVTLAQARYHFEHSALPRYFYEVPENMLEVLENAGTYQMWTSLADENGVEYPYQPEDFAEHLYTTADGATLLQVEMPRPEDDAQCYRVYLVYNAATGDAGYYTVEYDGILGENALLCGWSQAHEHTVYGGAAVVDKADDSYGTVLLAEARQVATLAGISSALNADGPAPAPVDNGPDESLALIACPEQGFTTRADPAYSWDYQEGTGISIYTQSAGKIPYVIVYRSEDLLAEPFEYIQEQYTPHIRQKYGEALADFAEVEDYEIAGRQLPAGLYSYYVGDTLVDMVRLMDSSGSQTVSYTAKYIHGEGDATLAALDAAIRNFRAD